MKICKKKFDMVIERSRDAYLVSYRYACVERSRDARVKRNPKHLYLQSCPKDLCTY